VADAARAGPALQEPNGAEEEAVLLIERSKESRNPAIKRDQLARCAQSAMQEAPEAQTH
jgi:hypothetical protein